MDVKIFTELVEEEALKQIYRLAAIPPFQDSQIRIMPDVHAGAGSVIGFTAPFKDKIIPNVIGIDIGCGMRVLELGKIEIDFEQLDKIIHQFIPAGYEVHQVSMVDFDFEELKCYPFLKNIERLNCSLGTLGGGNHFIEIDVDEFQNKYLIIHTGSRNLGKQVAEYYQQKAINYISGADTIQEVIKETIEQYRAQGRQQEIEQKIADIKKDFRSKIPQIPKDLCYLEGSKAQDYLHDMAICQRFAQINRWFIAKIICKKMGWVAQDEWECVHNYINFYDKIMRKGSISAHEQEKVLIPLNMRDGCIVGYGKGNKDWNYSAPHGAGRLMSRGQAKASISMEDFVNSMSGIYTTSVNSSTLDESPMAYKPMECIIDNINPSVKIEKIIKPVYNFKASE